MYRMMLTCLVLLTGCVSVAAERPTGDMKGWKSYRVEIGESIVSFRVPPGESKEFMSRPVPARIDSANKKLFDEAGIGPNLLDRYWDYKDNKLFGVEGTLRFIIAVRRSNESIENHKALQNAVEETSRLSSVLQSLEEGKPLASNRPMHYEPVQVAGKDGLLVRFEISPSAYVFAIDQYHYLRISYSAGGFRDPIWRAEALAAAESILQSIRIDPRDPAHDQRNR